MQALLKEGQTVANAWRGRETAFRGNGPASKGVSLESLAHATCTSEKHLLRLMRSAQLLGLFTESDEGLWSVCPPTVHVHALCTCARVHICYRFVLVFTTIIVVVCLYLLRSRHVTSPVPSFQNTPVSALLQASHPRSFKAAAEMLGGTTITMMLVMMMMMVMMMKCS